MEEKTEKEIEQAYESAVDMFATDGWKNFIEEVTNLESIVTNSAVDNALSNDQWQYCRGQVHQLRSIIGYEDFIKVSREARNADSV